MMEAADPRPPDPRGTRRFTISANRLRRGEIEQFSAARKGVFPIKKPPKSAAIGMTKWRLWCLTPALSAAFPRIFKGLLEPRLEHFAHALCQKGWTRVVNWVKVNPLSGR